MAGRKRKGREIEDGSNGKSVPVDLCNDKSYFDGDMQELPRGEASGGEQKTLSKLEEGLREMQQLHKDGILTHEELEAEKEKLQLLHSSTARSKPTEMSTASYPAAPISFAPDREGRRRIAPKRFCPPHWQKDGDKAPRRPLLHEELCFNCNDGGELLECSVCPKVYHVDEECAGLPKGKIPKGMWMCPWHSCFECDRKSSQAGGMLYHCTECPTSFCFDHCPDEFKEPPSDAEIRDHKFIKEDLERKGVVNLQSWLFFTCQECAPAAEKRRQLRAEEDRIREQRLEEAKQQAIIREQERQKARERAKEQHDAQMKKAAEMKAHNEAMMIRQAHMHAGWVEQIALGHRHLSAQPSTGACTMNLPAGWSNQQQMVAASQTHPANSEEALLEANGWKVYVGEITSDTDLCA